MTPSMFLNVQGPNRGGPPKRTVWTLSTRTVGLAVAVLALPGAPTAAQAPGDDAFRRFALDLHLGYELMGPGAALTDAYEEAGYGDRSPGGCLIGSCFEGIDYPHGWRADRPETSVGLDVRLYPSWSVGIAGGRGAAGSVEGYDLRAANATSAIFYETSWLALRGTYHAGPVRLALGPAVEFARWTADRTGGPDPSREAVERDGTTSLGFVAQGAVTVWSWSWVGTDLLVRYRDGGRSLVADLEGNELPVHSRTLFIGAGVRLGGRGPGSAPPP